QGAVRAAPLSDKLRPLRLFQRAGLAEEGHGALKIIRIGHGCTASRRGIPRNNTRKSGTRRGFCVINTTSACGVRQVGRRNFVGVTRHPLCSTRTSRELDPVPVDEGLVRRLESSFALLRQRGDELVGTFYAKLFEQHPAVRALF